MTPENQRKLDEIYDWMLQKKRQQITLPLDDSSRNILGTGLSSDGAGATTLIETLALSGNAENIDVPAPYVGTRLVVIDGVRYEIPYIAIV